MVRIIIRRINVDKSEVTGVVTLLQEAHLAQTNRAPAIIKDGQLWNCWEHYVTGGVVEACIAAIGDAASTIVSARVDVE